MKKFLTCFVATLTVLGSSVPALAADNMSVYVNNKKVYYDVQPQTINGRIMVPMRATFSALGADVTYHKDLGAISAQKGNDRVVMLLGEKRMGVFEISTNEAKKFVDSDVAPTVINGRTLIPLRAVSDCFDCDIAWNNQTKSVYITFTDANTNKETSRYNPEDDDLVSPEQFDKNIALKQAYFDLACDLVRLNLEYGFTAQFSPYYLVSRESTEKYGERVYVDGFVTAQTKLGTTKTVMFNVFFNVEDKTVDAIFIDNKLSYNIVTDEDHVMTLEKPSYSLKGYYY